MDADRDVHLEESVDLVKKALALDPQNGAYMDSLGWVYFRLGKYDEAEDNLRKASSYLPRRKRSEEHTSELQSPDHLVCRLLLEKKKNKIVHDDLNLLHFRNILLTL